MGRLAPHKQRLLLLCVIATVFGERPRMSFTDRDTTMVRRRLPQTPVRVLTEGEDAVTAVGPTHISRIHFRCLQELSNCVEHPVELPVEWGECAEQTRACIYNITIIHKRTEANQIFACGINGRDIACCNMDISEHSVKCTPSETVNNINKRMRDFIIKEGEASIFVESPDGAGLYITYSGPQGSVGIHKFGKHIVRPAYSDKEQHYIKLIVSKQGNINDVPQDKIYGFYNEKNQDAGMDSDMWKVFVTQICLNDTGGPKMYLQFTWTSQFNARLFCGDKRQKQHFSELLDVVTVEAEQWQDTRVYGLFKNKWGMRAVCVYTIQDIDRVFKTSPFKDSDPDSQLDRPRMCVADSTKLHIETLKQIEADSEMEECIEPVNGSGPLLISHHHYTHITAHNFTDNHTVLFIALNNGTVHKVMHKQTGGGEISFVVAEYRPFNHRAHVDSLDLHPSTRRLYVSSGTELVQLDVANCQGYGDSCEECVLARDPFCGWSEDRCAKDGSLQDTEHGNLAICPTSALKAYQHQVPGFTAEVSDDAVEQILIPLGSRYFFECPVTYLHAHYTWYHDNSPVPCGGAERRCLLLIPCMEPEQAGTYTCVSEEEGYSRVRAQYRLDVEDGAESFSPGSLLWLTIITALLVQS
ncbi:semaphorin-7A-like [Eucyclogobius newberryi]|uniref:semaphorin-7A-like n=1 Tax=Eucyclogobius newberryi TaxID=166745 RepID=UPI003B5A9874